MKKKLFIVIAVLIPVICAALLFCDFHAYRKDSKFTEPDAGGIVFSITAYDGKSESKPFLKSLGHAWLSVENGTGSSVFIKDHEIMPGETLTFSVWALSGHMGVVYNLEPNFIDRFGRYDGRRTLSVNIDKSKLRVISDFIDKNDRWTAAKNCTYFSTMLWNEVVPDEYDLNTQIILYTPGRLAKALDEYKNTAENYVFGNVGDTFIYEDGERKDLKLCQ